MEQQEKVQNRKNSITFRLTDYEAEQLNQEIAAAGLSASAYIRNRLEGSPIVKVYQPRELLQHLSAIGNNINQIARVANTHKSLNAEAVQTLQAEVRKLQQEVYKFVGEADVKCQ